MSEPTRINLTTADGTVLYTLGWSHPITDEQLYRVMRAMGYHVRWAPWYKRLWWWLKRLFR